MLADRDALGSVLEATWLTSTGAMLRVLARSGAFDFSFNQPPSADALFDAGREADGQLVITPSTGLPVLVEMCAHANVREAAEGLLARLPRPASPQSPSLELLRAPVWSTWARFKMDVDQAKVESFANEIAARAFPRSHLEIDDRWSTRYGDLLFDEVKFPDAAGMVRRLHGLGFGVTVWVVPFAEPSSAAYAEGAARGYWLKDADGAPIEITWWQGQGVALNVSDAGALRWFRQRLEALRESTGVDGFKFDAGEAMFVPEGVTADPNVYCGQWSRFAATFGGGGEVRCASRSQDAGLWTRTFDKDSRWGLQNGLRALLTSTLRLGVLGYPFVLPDMVGGNAYSEEMTLVSEPGARGSGFGARGSEEMAIAPEPVDPAATAAAVVTAAAAASSSSSPASAAAAAVATATFATASPPSAAGAAAGAADRRPPTADRPASSLFYGSLPPRELYVRWCFANALLPAVQFSIAPWQYDEQASEACRKALALRGARLPALEALAEEAALSGTPLVRPLWWHAPSDPTCQWIDDQFMLGNSTLVAPVLEASAHSRSIYLPTGRWLGRYGQVHAGPRWLVDYRVALDELAAFELLS